MALLKKKLQWMCICPPEVVIFWQQLSIVKILALTLANTCNERHVGSLWLPPRQGLCSSFTVTVSTSSTQTQAHKRSALKVHGGTRFAPYRRIQKTTYISGCAKSTKDKISLETLSSISPKFMVLQITLKSFLASLYAPAGLLSTRKQTRFPLVLLSGFSRFLNCVGGNFFEEKQKRCVVKRQPGTQHFITQYLRGNLAILPEFNKTEENPDPVHFKIDEKRAAFLQLAVLF